MKNSNLLKKQTITHVLSKPITQMRSTWFITCCLLVCISFTTQAQTITWNGTFSNDWNLPQNWTPQLLPTATSDVIIPNVTSNNYPEISTIVHVKSVKIELGGALTISGTGTIPPALFIDNATAIGLENLGTLTNGSGIVITDPGGIGLDNTSTGIVDNNGTITINGTTGTSGIRNLNEFTNKSTGIIRIGNSTSINGTYGIVNKDIFNNESEGRIEIDHTSLGGIFANTSSAFTNLGTITIGANYPIGQYGIYIDNTARFNNYGGSINIDYSSVYGIYIKQGNFHNEATITMGANNTVGSDGIYNDGSFSNDAGTINTDLTTNSGITNLTGSFFTNKASISMGANNNIGLYGISNSGTFNNNTGTINIDRAATRGIDNLAGGTFTNNATITMGANNGGFFGISNIDTFVNSTTGSINIDNVLYRGISNTVGSFTNNGAITMGTNVGNYGIYNDATFENSTTTGVIKIDNVSLAGINNSNTATFTNNSTINIGPTVTGSGPGTAGVNGIVNNGTFNNNSVIIIDNSSNSAISNESGNFENIGNIFLGGIYSVGNYGIYSDATFTNISSGEINIDLLSLNSINNDTNGGFTNSATINIGANKTSVGDTGIHNKGVFNNEDPGTINIDYSSSEGIHNFNTFNNNANIIIGANNNVGIGITNRQTSTFNNTGFISIDQTTTGGIYNYQSSDFTNESTIAIGANNSLTGYGVRNEATFLNSATGNITIQRTTTSGISNVYIDVTPLFSNDGTITIGDNINSAGNFGINNDSGNFNNNGLINIDNVSIYGLWNKTVGFTFTNIGEINIGDFAPISGIGIHNEAAFINDTSGIINIDNTTLGAILNKTEIFTNKNKIIIGANNSVGTYGIATNGGRFVNDTSGDVKIDNTNQHAIWNNGSGNATKINNSGNITIGSTIGISAGSNGITNEGGIFTNYSSGVINIDQVTNAGINIISGTFDNNFSITIGANNSVGDTGIFNLDNFNNNSNGTIKIDNTDFKGIQNEAGIYTNTGDLIIGSNSSVGTTGIYNNGFFYNNNDGTIGIENSTNNGIRNFTNGSFTNENVITIGAITPVELGVDNLGTFTNNNIINIDSSTISGIQNSTGTFTNTATITIGVNVSTGDYGINNKATFYNNSLGNITIDRSTYSGIYNEIGATFFTNAAITIGANETVGLFGIYNIGDFENNTFGNIIIDSATNSGIHNLSGTFTNQFNITMGDIASIGNYGIYNEAIFINETINGNINIDNSTINGIRNASGTFTNQAIITIDNTTNNPGLGGLLNATTFNNTDGTLTLDDTNFVNNGTFITSTLGSVLLTGDLDTSIAGTSITSFSNLVINKTSGNVSLENSIGITSNLDLTNGKILLLDYDITLDQAATITNSSNANYLVTGGLGAVIKNGLTTAFEFPVGFDQSTYNPIVITQTGTVDDIKVRCLENVLEEGATGNIRTTNVIDVSWEITEALLGGNNLDITPQWNASDELSGFDNSFNAVSYYDGTGWSLIESELQNASGTDPFTQTRTGVTETGVFTVESPSQTIYFVTTWKTDNPGTSSDIHITIPTFSGDTYNYQVDWDYDGATFNTDNTIYTGDATHDYGTANTYTVAIRGVFPRIYFNDSGDKEKILTVEQWGENPWTSMNSAFYGCANLTITNTLIDTPNLTNVTDMYRMFQEATSFNSPIDSWNVGNVENMNGMFHGATSFNQDIGGWDVSSVNNMKNMFRSATSFNSPINNWVVSSVINMNGMFYQATFNQDIEGWDVSSVTDMSHMFRGANSFNQDIGGWDVSSVTDMVAMFRNATSFNQDLGNWDISNVITIGGMFANITLSTANYDATLIGWATLDTGETQIPTDLTFDGGNSQYCAGEAAWNSLDGPYNWTITDGGLDPTCSVALSPIVYLQGTYINPNDVGLMNDALRVANLIPTISPYADLVTADSSVFDLGGTSGSGAIDDDIVDWVWVELRDATDNTVVIDGQSALLQRDGDIVGVDGISALSFSQSVGNYYVAIAHRNHLGIITANTVSLSSSATVLDLSNDSALINGGTNAVVDMGNSVFALYAGDYDGNGQIQNSDLTQVTTLLGTSGYSDADADMNSQVQNADINNIISPNVGNGEQLKNTSIKNNKPLIIAPLSAFHNSKKQ